MADIDSNLKQWSTTESNNKPTGATVIGTGLDENLRMIQTVVRQDLATKGADIVSTGTMDIGAVAGFFHDITGTTTVVNLGTVSAGIWKILKFEGAVPLIHSTALTLPGATNITTADGDVMTVSSEGSGNWRVASYLPYAALMHKIIDAAGDTIEGTAADTAARKPAYTTVAAHATTCDVWNARETILSGAAVTFTDIVDADYVGQVAWVYMNAAHVWTDGAVFDVQGGATYTTAVGDWVRINAVTVSTFDVTIFPANGGVVSSLGRTPITLGTSVATTSGTSVSFTGIPDGVKRVTMSLVGVSLSGTDALQVQIGPVAGVETSGYLGSVGSGATFANFTVAFGLITTGGAGSVHHGTLTLTLENASTNIWTASGTLGLSNGATVYLFAYSKPLAGALSVIKLMTNGSDTFDAGECNITYE